MKKKMVFIVSTIVLVIVVAVFVVVNQESKADNIAGKKGIGVALLMNYEEMLVNFEPIVEIVDDTTPEEVSNNQASDDGQSNSNNGNQNQGNNSNGNSGNDNCNNTTGNNTNPEVKDEQPKVDVPPKEEEPQVDDEYNRLIAGTFPTNESCTAKGLEVALSDTVNISGSMCETVAYKGKIIGYKLYIRYSNGEYKHYPNK